MRVLDVVVTLGFQASPADFDVDSDRVKFVEFTPLAELLRGVAVVVTAGGAGTVIGSLEAGVPMVVARLGADQPMHAQSVAAASVGVALLAAR
jgi:UDP:flavonoid glycosyltransferase YjiC (YdhE family)